MSSKLNGSAERFTAALRDLVSEAAGNAAEKAVQPIREDMAAMEERLNTRMDRLVAIRPRAAVLPWPQMSSNVRRGDPINRLASGCQVPRFSSGFEGDETG